MQISNLAKYATGVTVAAALLAGCSSGGSSAVSPSTGMQNAVRSGHLQTLKVGGLYLAAAMLPQVKPVQIAPDKKKHHKSKKGDQYISNFYGSELLVFDYPKSDASIGTISGVTDAQGECTQTGKKNYWVVASGADEIEEFAFGGTSPIATLSESTGEPAGCAIDAKTGDLATTILGTGDVVIFTGASGTGTTVSDGLDSSYFDTYDASGNLYVDGITESDTYGVVEMASGSSSFKAVTLNNSIEFPGEMQWDGKYVTLNDQEAHGIYQYTCSDDSCTSNNTVELDGTSDCVQTWISGKYVYCPDFPNEVADVFAYPAGGSAIATLTGSYDGPIGSVAIAK
jgi:hypothetical protein